MKEDYKDGGFGGMLERQFGTVQDLIVDVFTGPGLHPTIGQIVPDSGIAFGAALNDEWHISEAPHSRFTTSVEARGSTNGFWAAGAVSHVQLDLYRTHDVGSFRMPQATVAIKYFDLAEMSFFGLGNQTSLRRPVVVQADRDRTADRCGPPRGIRIHVVRAGNAGST